MVVADFIKKLIFGTIIETQNYVNIEYIIDNLLAEGTKMCQSCI